MKRCGVLVLFSCLWVGFGATNGQDLRDVRVLQFPSHAAGYLGVEIRDVTSADVSELGLPKEAGVYVTGVQEDSPAARADLREGDVILEYAGLEVWSVAHLQRLVGETPVDREVPLVLLRARERTRTAATIQSRTGRRFPHGGELEWLHEVPGYRLEERLRDIEPGVFVARRGPMLGITVHHLTPQLAEFLGVEGGRGVLVTEVREDSPASEAGLQAGDVIVSIDGRSVETTADLSQRVRSGEHDLKIVREKQILSVTVNVEGAEPPTTRSRRL